MFVFLTSDYFSCVSVCIRLPPVVD